MSSFVSTTVVQFLHAGHIVSSSGVQRSCFNSFTYHVDNPLVYNNAVATKNAYRARFSSQVASIIYPLLSDRYVGDSIGVWCVNVSGDVFGFGVGAGSGAVTGPALPLPVAVFQSFGTNLRGGNYVGKKYWGAIPESYVVGDELTVAALSTFHTIANRVQGNFGVTIGTNSGTFHPVCWSRRLSPAPPAGQTVALFQTGTTDATLSSWRHRRERTQR